jgi:hypothetical protein
MTLCFTEALRQGMTIYVRPHLDDGTANGAWRNGLLLQPEAKHSGYRWAPAARCCALRSLRCVAVNTGIYAG